MTATEAILLVSRSTLPAVTNDAVTVLREALALPESDRASIAAELFASLDGPDGDYSPEAADAWAREIERRVERVVSGASPGIPLDEAIAQVEAARATARG